MNKKNLTLLKVTYEVRLPSIKINTLKKTVRKKIKNARTFFHTPEKVIWISYLLIILTWENDINKSDLWESDYVYIAKISSNIIYLTKTQQNESKTNKIIYDK